MPPRSSGGSRASPLVPDEIADAIAQQTHPGRVADAIAASLPSLSTQTKQELLATADVKARLARLVAALTKEAEVLELGSRIQSQVESEVGKSQRDYYLREQLKAIQKELGQTDERAQETDELRQKIEAAGMTEEAKKEALRELERLSRMSPAAAEYTVARTYLEWLVALPWSTETEDSLDLTAARAVLDADHTGLEKVKERILEYLAVKSIRPAGKDPILCFVGPPGVGRLARALDRAGARAEVTGSRRGDAGRGRNSRPPADVYRRAAEPDHPRAAPRRVQEPGPHARRDRQAGDGLPRRPGLGASRGPRPRAERRIPRPLRGRAV